jgi:hypothetical protein
MSGKLIYLNQKQNLAFWSAPLDLKHETWKIRSQGLFLITGLELVEFICLVWVMTESFGSDRRIANYQGKRLIGLLMHSLLILIF